MTHREQQQIIDAYRQIQLNIQIQRDLLDIVEPFQDSLHEQNQLPNMQKSIEKLINKLNIQEENVSQIANTLKEMWNVKGGINLNFQGVMIDDIIRDYDKLYSLDDALLFYRTENEPDVIMFENYNKKIYNINDIWIDYEHMLGKDIEAKWDDEDNQFELTEVQCTENVKKYFNDSSVKKILVEKTEDGLIIRVGEFSRENRKEL